MFPQHCYLQVWELYLFHLLTKRKVPAFLGSSFAFLGGYAAIAPMADGADNSALLPYACFGVACSGLLYLVLSLLIKIFGTGKVMRFFPPIVTGPIIIAIGLTPVPVRYQQLFRRLADRSGRYCTGSDLQYLG